MSKLILTLVPGRRTEKNIHQAVADAASRLSQDSPLPAIFTDGEPSYKEAVLKAFGRPYPAFRKSILGRPPEAVLRIPHELVYAQIVKHRQGGKTVEVEIRPIFGKGKLDEVVRKLGWNKANTSAIERFNLTDRQRNRRKQRKTLGFSKQSRFHDWMSWISVLWYNFHFKNLSLNLKNEDGILRKRTPAMAAGISDYPYSTLELMRMVVLG